MQTQPIDDENVQTNPFAAAERRFEHIRGYLAHSALAHDHAEIEQELFHEGFELMRLLLQGHFDCRAGAECRRQVTGADAIARPEARSVPRKLETLFGTVEVRRLSYGAPGVCSLRPADADLNLPERLYSDGVARRVAETAATVPYSQVVEQIASSTGAQIASRQAMEVAVDAAQDFEAFYETRRAASGREVARSGALVVISADGKGVRMRQEDLREATRRAALKRTRARGPKLSKGDRLAAKRMATVAAVYTIERYERTPDQILATSQSAADASEPRPKPENKRVWASLEREPRQVLREAFEEAARRDPARRKQWVGLVDGAKPQLDALKDLAAEFGVKLVIVLDLVHVLEYLWKAAKAFHPASPLDAERWVTTHLTEVLFGFSRQIASRMRVQALFAALDAEPSKAVEDCATYLVNNHEYLRYHDYLAEGVPIATGVIEGACRHVVKDRMDVTGARWGLRGAEAVLKLRSLRTSGDFDQYWQFHQGKELERNHTSRYAQGRIPSVQRRTSAPFPRSNLRLVPSP
jgi:hypothetical protein